MNKPIVLLILGAVVGIVAGAAIMHQWLMPQLWERDAELARLDQHQSVSGSPGNGEAARLARLEEERVAYEDNLAKLRAEVESLKQRSTVEAASPELAVVEDPLTAADGTNGPPQADNEGERDNRRRGRGGPWGEGTPEEQEARRQEFRTRMQDNLTNFFTGELEKSSTPAMQERLVALEGQVNDMMELRRQMREAETDGDRKALGAAYEESMVAAQGIMKEQRRDIIDTLATQFNITNSKDQAAFRQAVQAAVESPFFGDNPSALVWNSGRGGGGGFGGGGGGGRPGGGGFGGGGPPGR